MSFLFESVAEYREIENPASVCPSTIGYPVIGLIGLTGPGMSYLTELASLPLQSVSLSPSFLLPISLIEPTSLVVQATTANCNIRNVRPGRHGRHGRGGALQCANCRRQKRGKRVHCVHDSGSFLRANPVVTSM